MKTLQSVSRAVEIYYSRLQLETPDINELFGAMSNGTRAVLKQKAREQMAEDGVPLWNSRAVDTISAYKAWGLDIEDLERRAKKMKQLEGKI